MGMGELSLADRATIANMSPEYGATMGFFPADHVTLQYLKLIGRSNGTVSVMKHICVQTICLLTIMRMMIRIDNDCWLVISGKVYDVTPFMDDHPGGDEVLLSATGKDATNDFEDVGHSDNAREMMEKYYIGEIDAATVPLKRTYIAPQQTTYNPDKTPEFVIKVLQFVVPFLILGLAFAVRQYTKEK